MVHHRRLVLLLIIAVAFFLRVLFNSYQLPPYWDYPNEIDKREDVLKLEELNFFHGYMQPSFLMNTMYLLYYPARWTYPTISQWLPNLRGQDLDTYYLWVGRIYMALFGALAVWLIYFLALRLTESPGLGLLAATLLAVTPIHVLGSRHMKEDMPLALFMTLTIFFLLGVVQRGARRDYILSALAAGLCFSTKWLGASILAPLLLAHVLGRPNSMKHFPPPGRRWLWPMVLGCFVVGFLIASPDYLIHVDVLIDGPKRAVQKVLVSHADGLSVNAFDEAFSDYFRTGLWPGLTPTLLISLLIGVGWLWNRNRRGSILIVCYIVYFYILIELPKARSYPHFQRYLQPIIPSIIVLAACGVEAMRVWILRVLRDNGWAVPNRVVNVAIVLLVLAWPLHDTILYLKHIPESTVLQCRDFILKNVPAGSIIYDDSYGPGLPRDKYEVRKYRRKDKLSVGAFPTEPCYVIYTSMGLGRFVEHPEANPEIGRWVFYVLGKGILVKKWEPDFRSFYAESPLIKLYRFEPSADPLDFIYERD